MESHRRSIAKTLSWRVVATVITACIAWVVTDEPRFAATIGLADTLIKLGAYYGHERVWSNIKFGRPRSPEYEI